MSSLLLAAFLASGFAVDGNLPAGNVVFENATNHAEDFERKFSATREFDTTQQLNDVQEELVTQMIKEIVEQIFNATVANW